MPYTKEDAARREKQLQEDHAELKKQMARRPVRSPVFAKPYGNTSSYQPATDMHTAGYIPPRDVYSPPAQNADVGLQVPDIDRSAGYDPEGGGGTFDGGGASGDWS